MRERRAEIHLGQGRYHGLRRHWDTLDPDLLVQHGRPPVEDRQGCLHAGPLLLPVLELRLLLLRREANAGQRARSHASRLKNSACPCSIICSIKRLIAPT